MDTGLITAVSTAFTDDTGHRLENLVYHRIEDINFDREYNGLLAAMRFFKLSEGVIITLEQKDRFEKEGYSIELIPAHEYMAGV